MAEPTPAKKRGFMNVIGIVVDALPIFTPAYIGGYLSTRGRVSISILAFASLVMFLVGAFLMIKLLRE